MYVVYARGPQLSLRGAYKKLRRARVSVSEHILFYTYIHGKRTLSIYTALAPGSVQEAEAGTWMRGT